MPTKDEFDEWRGHPVSEWVMGIMQAHAEKQKTMWADMAWNDGNIDPQALLEARVRADCYLEIPNASFEDWSNLSDPET